MQYNNARFGNIHIHPFVYNKLININLQTYINNNYYTYDKSVKFESIEQSDDEVKRLTKRLNKYHQLIANILIS